MLIARSVPMIGCQSRVQFSEGPDEGMGIEARSLQSQSVRAVRLRLGGMLFSNESCSMHDPLQFAVTSGVGLGLSVAKVPRVQGGKYGSS